MTRRTNIAAIAAGTSLSSAVYVGAAKLVSIGLDANWLTATTITFQGSYDGVNFFEIYDGAGNEVSYTVAASQVIPIPGGFEGCLYLKIRSGPSGSPVNQTNATNLTCLFHMDVVGRLR